MRVLGEPGTRLRTAPEKQKQDQNDNERSRFKERDAKQALVLQHVAPPPGRNCRPRPALFLCDTRSRRREILEWKPFFDANTLFSKWTRVPPLLCAVTYNAWGEPTDVEIENILVV